MKTELNDVMAATANKATIVGGVTAVIGNLSSTDLAAYGGLLLAFLGFIVNIYFKHQDAKFKQREDHRKEKEHLIRVAKFNRRIGLPDTRSENCRIDRRSRDDQT